MRSPARPSRTWLLCGALAVALLLSAGIGLASPAEALAQGGPSICGPPHDTSQEAADCRRENEERWRTEGCTTDPDRPVYGGFEFCKKYGNRRYEDFCIAAPGGEPRPSGIDEFCEEWPSSPLFNPLLTQPEPPPPVTGPFECNPPYETPEEAKDCRSADEERWRTEGCRTSPDAPVSGTFEFCRAYGNQRYIDFCKPDFAADPDDPSPYLTPPGEERPPSIDQFCRDWPSSPLFDGAGPAGDVAPGASEPPGGEDQGTSDIFVALGGGDPLCHYPGRLLPTQRAACQLTGSTAHAYPVWHYGIDYQGFSDGLLNVKLGGIAEAGIQAVLGFVWICMVWLVKVTLLLLQWAFEIPVIGGCQAGQDVATEGACRDQLPEVSTALRNLHENVLGTPWMLAALGVAGLWGLWNGLVRQRVSHTLAGLLATVVLMAAALAIINNPAGTVGWAARLANDASLGALNATSRAGADNPTGSFAAAQEGLFDTLVTRPWCALQFGDVAWCLGDENEQPDQSGTPVDSRVSVADVWLTFPAGGAARENLYKMLKGEKFDNSFWAKAGDWAKEAVLTFAFGGVFSCNGLFSDRPCPAEQGNQRDAAKAMEDKFKEVMGGEAPEKVALQEAGGTWQRSALLIVVVITLLGSILVLGWVAIRLFVAAVAVLVLLLFTPVMLFAPAFGDSGRKAFGSWAVRLAAAAVAKFLFAIVLTILVVVAGILAGLNVGWFAVWLLQLAFWWGILMKRRALMSLANFDVEGAAKASQGSGWGGLRTLLTGYYGYRAIRDVGGDLVAKPIGAAYRATRGNALIRERAKGKAVHEAAGRMLGNRANQGVGFNRRVTATRRGALQGKEQQLGREISRVQGERETNRSQLDQAKRRQREAPQALRDRVHDLEGRRGRLAQAQSAAVRAAQSDRSRWQEAEKNRRHYENALLADPANPALENRLAEATNRADAAWDSHERNVAATGVAKARLASVDAQLEHARDAVGGYKPPTGGAPQSLEETKRQAEVKWLANKDDGLRAEEDQLRAEQEQVRDEQRALGPDSSGEPAEADRRRWIDDRRAAIEMGADPTGDQQLLDAGIDPEEYRAAPEEEQEAMRERSRQAMELDHRLIERYDADPDTLPPWQERDAKLLAGDAHYEADLARHRYEGHSEARLERRRRRWRWW